MYDIAKIMEPFLLVSNISLATYWKIVNRFHFRVSTYCTLKWQRTIKNSIIVQFQVKTICQVFTVVIKNANRYSNYTVSSDFWLMNFMVWLDIDFLSASDFPSIIMHSEFNIIMTKIPSTSYLGRIDLRHISHQKIYSS